MSAQLTFLHTAPVLIDTFNELLKSQCHDFTISHVLDESLLQDTLALGHISESIATRIENRVREAVELGSDLVVCTCSSIGSVAEAMNPVGEVEVQRIDRAMADEAVRLGNKIILAAALKSTLGPTRELLNTSAEAIGKTIELVEVVIDDAWAKLQAGDKTGYTKTIAEALNDETIQGDVIVLAQGSMAEAASQIKRDGVPVLSSPKIGLERAVKTLTERTA